MNVRPQGHRIEKCERTHAAPNFRGALKGPVALDQLMPLYRDYDIFVLPTQPGEGIPRVLMEAMAAGLPVVTTSVSGISSLIAHDVNGWLIAKSTADAVADAVRALMATPALRQRLIQGGYQTARAHTLERQAAEMMRAVQSNRRLTLAGPLVGASLGTSGGKPSGLPTS